MNTNIERAMTGESVLCEFDTHIRTNGMIGLRDVGDLYEDPETVAMDMICNVCHFLNLDERAGCMTPEAIETVLKNAFGLFKDELKHEDF